MTKPFLHVASMTRGLYRRVAEKFGVDPSYVSRIARGERRSPQIEEFLNREIQKILASVSKPKSKTKKRYLAGC
jgi:transcriptional regulator with XRE-family HTH domain